VEYTHNLHALIEAIRSGDGFQPKVAYIRFHLRIYSSDNDLFAFQPVIVQTAGTISDTANVAVTNISAMLDSAIDDVFGHQKIGPMKIGRRIPGNSSANNFVGIEVTLEVPANVLEILNREAESERLQNLSFVLVGATQNNDTLLSFDGFVEIAYVEVRKKIILR
jgi:hypothetical protein